MLLIELINTSHKHKSHMYKMEDGKIAEATALINSGKQSVALTSTWLKG